MASTASIKVVKTILYRGALKTWSNRYHFTSGVPADNTKWTTFSDAITAAEKLIYGAGSNTCTIIGTYGYGPGSDVPVFSKTYSLAGTLANSTRPLAPGDAAVLVRFSTADRSTKNHAIYLFNYFHGALTTALATPDAVAPEQVTAMGVYASAWASGFSDGAVTHVRASPNGHVATGYLVDTKVRHRDFVNG